MLRPGIRRHRVVRLKEQNIRYVWMKLPATKKAVVLTTDKKGHAESDSLPLATYYIKETKAPAGCGLDAVAASDCHEYQAGKRLYIRSDSREKPVKKWIEIQKYIAITLTGNKKPYNR